MTKHRFRTENGIIVHLRQLRRADDHRFGPTMLQPAQPRLVKLLGRTAA